ncbi:MAG: DinB family protein [Chthonomonas sp.]|nr:DinB family protein [Chthonomonas sp.]
MHFDLVPIGDVDVQLAAKIATLQDGTREWRGEFESMSPEELTWQPYPDGPSIGGCILHMAGCEAWWLQAVVRGEELDASNPAIAYDAALDQDNHVWPTPPAESPEWYFDILSAQREKTIALITEHNDPDSVHVRPSGNSFTFRWIVARLVQHDSYHGGQCVMLHEMWKKRG